MKTIVLSFKGYWREVKKSAVPEVSGVYCVYAATYHGETETVSLRELLYVGESSDVRDRLANHERLKDWKRRLKAGETLCYAVATVNSSDRERAEAAVTSLRATSSMSIVSRLKPPTLKPVVGIVSWKLLSRCIQNGKYTKGLEFLPGPFGAVELPVIIRNCNFRYAYHVNADR